KTSCIAASPAAPATKIDPQGRRITRRRCKPGRPHRGGRSWVTKPPTQHEQEDNTMKKLYKYTGTISGFSYRRNNPNALPFATLDLYDMNDDDKAPIRIEATGGLADYIQAIEWTDAEERYLTAEWYY